MLGFARRNLVRNRARSALALLGLAASTAGVVLLVAISLGARRMIDDAMDMAKGVIVLQKDAPDPLFSKKVPAGLDAKLAAVAGVSAVVPEVWTLAFSLEDRGGLARGITNQTALLGVDPEKRAKMRQGGIFTRTLVQGRMFRRDEADAVLISRRIAREFKKKLGSSFNVMGQALTVTGIFDTGTPIFDNVIVAQEERVRAVADLRSSSVSCYYLETEKGADVERIAERVREVVPRLDVKSTVSWGREVNTLVGDLDPYLAAISVVAGAIGALGVVNTMLMSVRERVREIGVLRATGWRRSDVFVLVLMEASLLGAFGGGSGALAGAGAAAIASHLLPIKPFAPPELVLASVLGAILLGALGGLYPAYYASRLDPIGAIRGGAS